MGLFDSWNVTNFKVVLAQEEVLAGQYVSGNVQFDVTDDMPFRRIYVDVWGQEEMRVVGEHAQQCCVFSHQTTLHGQADVDETATDSTSDLNSKLTSLKRGSYNFPFTVQIPVDTPPTIRDGPTSASTASLTYYVSAFVVDEHSTTAATTSSPQFDVLTPRPSEPPFTSTLTAMSVTETPQHLCGCFGSGAHITCTLFVSNPNISLQRKDGTTLVHTKVVINTGCSVVPVDDIILCIRRICYRSTTDLSQSSSSINHHNVNNTHQQPQLPTAVASRILMFERLQVSMPAAGSGGEEERFLKTILSIPSAYYRRFGPTHHGVLFSQQYELIAVNNSDGVVIGVLPLVVDDNEDVSILHDGSSPLP